MQRTINHSLTLLALLMVVLIAAMPVEAAQDVRLVMKDGSIWRGDLNVQVEVTYQYRAGQLTVTGSLAKVAERYIVVKQSNGRDKTLFRKDLIDVKSVGEAIATDAAAMAMDEKKPATAKPKGDTKAPREDLPPLFVLPLDGMVGLEFRTEEIEAIGEEADKYGRSIIVFVIDSGGGLVSEMEDIHVVLTDLAQRHRLVGWIKHATSGACATAIHFPEIYFMTEGRAGGMTAFDSVNGVVKGQEHQDWLRTAGNWMEQGGRDRKIAKAMIDNTFELSYDKDPVTGEVTWHQDLSGEFVASRRGQNLEFTSSQAVHCGFAQGIADTTGELAELLDLPMWYETNDYGREIAKEWQDTVERCNREVPRILAEFQFKNTTGSPEKVLGSRIKNLRELIQWWRRAPNAMMLLGVPPEDVLQQQIEQLRRQLAARR